MRHLAVPVHSIDTAPEASRSAFDAARKAFGFVPNLVAQMTESPALAQAFVGAHAALANHASLTARELQIVLLAVSHTNACPYCMAAHTGIGQAVGLAPAEIAALRNGEPLAEPRLEALRAFTVAMVRDRGHVSEDAVETFAGAGFGARAVLDVIAAIAYKTMSNYMDHVVDAPLDVPLQKWAWTPETTATV